MLHPSARWLALLLIVAAPAALADPEVKVTSVERKPVTLVDVDVKSQPLGKVVSKIARQLGFAKVAFDNDKKRMRLATYKIERKPAWVVLAELARRHHLELQPASGTLWFRALAGREGSASCAPGRLWVQRAAGGLLVSFRQDAPGKTRPPASRFPKYAPYDLAFDAEPGLVWRCVKWAISDQIDASGGAKRVLVASHFRGLRPQLDPADKIYPWPGLQKMRLEVSVELVTRWNTAKITKLAVDQKPRDVTHDGKVLFGIAAVKNRIAAFTDVDLSLVHELRKQNWSSLGDYIGSDLEKKAGVRLVVRDAKGEQFAPDIISGKGGGGEPLMLRLRFRRTKLARRGGIGGLTLEVRLAGKRATRALVFEFDKLLE